MMISGKSALRKKRFTDSSERRVPAVLSLLTHFLRAGLRLGFDQCGIEYADIGQVPVPLGEIEPVADHESVGDLEADVAHGHVDFPPFRLRQERADLEARGFTGV